jgi:pyruvate/2-oxoglutarate dehydrogenase complex dihydrolipoamide acyltransferase (E2) component
MAFPLHVPRINNNDDTVRVVRLLVVPGGFVRRGDAVAEIETDKSVAELVAERDGFVVKILGAAGTQVSVGGVLMWVGESADEIVPEAPAESEPVRRAAVEERWSASRLSPEGFTHAEHRRLTRFMLSRGYRAFVFSFHSPSVQPGFTPYVRNGRDIEAFLENCRNYFKFFLEELGGLP